MNASLLRQYKTGHTLASDKQKQKKEKEAACAGAGIAECEVVGLLRKKTYTDFGNTP